MAWIRRKWTAVEADEWTKEDWMAIVIAPIIYILLSVGVALSFLLMVEGFIILGISIILIVLMHWIIDPKLKAVSEEYEKKQKEYLEELEEAIRWNK